MRVTNFENLKQYQVSAPLNYEENYIMNLTSETVAILKNFSDINQNILVKPGNQLQTISTLKNILLFQMLQRSLTKSLLSMIYQSF